MIKVHRNLDHILAGSKFEEPSSGDVGYDLRCLESFWLWPFRPKKIKTGVHVAIEPQVFQATENSLTKLSRRIYIKQPIYGQILDRSSMASQGVATLGGVIDPSYRGEIVVILLNLGLTPRRYAAGHKIAQLVFVQCVTPELQDEPRLVDLGITQRNQAGFGSTDRAKNKGVDYADQGYQQEQVPFTDRAQRRRLAHHGDL